VKVLVACEYSGVVREAFHKRGHDAWSCDLLPTDIPGQHIQGDAIEAVNNGSWDLMVAHPPCTHLAVSGARHFAKKILDGRQQQGIDLFMGFVTDKIPKWCIENPVGIMSSLYRKPDQIINPWQFGEPYQKTTCLWLKGLSKLNPTNIVGRGEFTVFASGKKHPKWYADALKLSPKERMKVRSKTFQGIADAMAEQWG